MTSYLRVGGSALLHASRRARNAPFSIEWRRFDFRTVCMLLQRQRPRQHAPRIWALERHDRQRKATRWHTAPSGCLYIRTSCSFSFNIELQCSGRLRGGAPACPAHLTPSPLLLLQLTHPRSTHKGQQWHVLSSTAEAELHQHRRWCTLHRADHHHITRILPSACPQV